MNWKKILASDFGLGTRWIEKESDMWAERLKESVYGWKNASGDQINDELCNALDHMMDRGDMPRADRARSTAAYNVRDVRLWVHIYRENTKSNNHVADSNHGDLIERAEYYIARYYNDGELGKAWDTATDPRSVTEVFNDLTERFGAITGYSDDDNKRIDAFCLKIGFDRVAYLNSRNF